jgi:hypothetical protein
MCILYVNLCVCVCYSILKGICLWFHCTVSVLFLFCYLCIYLHVMYVYDLFHVLLLQLQTSGSMKYMCVCVYICVHVTEQYFCSCCKVGTEVHLYLSRQPHCRKLQCVQLDLFFVFLVPFISVFNNLIPAFTKSVAYLYMQMFLYATLQ